MREIGVGVDGRKFVPDYTPYGYGGKREVIAIGDLNPNENSKVKVFTARGWNFEATVSGVRGQKGDRSYVVALTTGEVVSLGYGTAVEVIR